MAIHRRRIVLFHRLDLTQLYAELAPKLAQSMDVIHLAYSTEEAAKLVEAKKLYIFKDEIRALHPKVTPDLALLEEIDKLIIEETSGAFCLNSAIQSDRGFKFLSYAEALHLTATYYTFWTHFIDENNVDLLLHEPCSLMFNFLPALILSQRGGYYIYNAMTPGHKGTFNHLNMTGFDFTCPDLDRNFDSITAGLQKPDFSRAVAFLAEYRQNFEVFLGEQLARRRPLWRHLVGALFRGATLPFRRVKVDRVLDNIDYWIVSYNNPLKRLLNITAYRHVKFDNIQLGEKYFFYPLHLEPEAVVLYHAHGIYKNQIKLIQNIAGQLPPGYMLYVKDHPHDYGYRDASDYHKLTDVPNIRLISTDIPGKEVIRHSQGVITITGTAGFEALLLGKQVYTFGKTFYSRAPRVCYLHHIRNLRDILYARRNETSVTDAELLPFVASYLVALQPGLTDFSNHRTHKYKIDFAHNASEIAASIQRTIADLWSK